MQPDASDSVEEDVILTQYMSTKRIESLAEDQKARLRQVVATHKQQRHWCEFKGGDGAASGAYSETVAEMQARERRRDRLMQVLPAYADPLPSAEEFVTGIEHKSDNADKAGQKWDVPRAFHSRKMHYLPRLRAEVMENIDWPFHAAYPDLRPASGGRQRLPLHAWKTIQQLFKARDGPEYVKHICAAHDGELRLLDNWKWVPFPASGGSINQACFWHYQFARQVETRRFLYDRNQEEWWASELTDDDVDSWTGDAVYIKLVGWWGVAPASFHLPPILQQQPQSSFPQPSSTGFNNSGCCFSCPCCWIMEKEGGRTGLLKREKDPASGGWQWSIVKGSVITLAELFMFARKLMSCYDIFQQYLDFEVLFLRRHHSVSHSGNAQKRRNAKELKFREAGRYGLDAQR